MDRQNQVQVRRYDAEFQKDRLFLACDDRQVLGKVPSTNVIQHGDLISCRPRDVEEQSVKHSPDYQCSSPATHPTNAD